MINSLTNSLSFAFRNGVFYQRDISLAASFEKAYLSLREKEGRMYRDDIVRTLPYLTGVAKKEWPVRASSMKMLIGYLKKQSLNFPVMELGCGNGWLANRLAESLKAEVYAVDVNETELLQGARVFSGNKNLSFVFGDVFSHSWEIKPFSAVILAGSVQYFPDFSVLIKRLFELLDPQGEIHILDSPFYNNVHECQSAHERSQNHFKSLGLPEMANNYFHHPRQVLDEFDVRIQYDPRSFSSLVERKIFGIPKPVFPWIRIKARI